MPTFHWCLMNLTSLVANDNLLISLLGSKYSTITLQLFLKNSQRLVSKVIHLPGSFCILLSQKSYSDFPPLNVEAP